MIINLRSIYRILLYLTPSLCVFINPLRVGLDFVHFILFISIMLLLVLFLRNGYIVKPNKFIILIYFLFVCQLISFLYNWEDNSSFGSLFSNFLVGGIIIYLISFLNTEENIGMVKSIIFTNILLVSIGLILIILSGDLKFLRSGIYFSEMWYANFGRNYTIVSNPNYYARMLLFCWPFTCAALLYTKTNWLRNILIITIILTFVLIMITLSRAGMITLLITVLLFIVLNKSGTKLMLVLFSLFVLVNIFSSSLIIDRFSSKIEQVESMGTELRILSMTVGIKTTLERNPLLGLGSGAAKGILSDNNSIYLVNKAVRRDNVELAVHNNFLLILMEQGLVGLVLFSSLILLIILEYNKKIKYSSKENRIMLNAGLISLIAFLLSGMTAVNLGMKLAWISMGIFVNMLQKENND